MNKDLMLAAAIVIALVALGGNFFVIYNDSNQINQNKSSLTDQIVSMQSSLTGLQSNVNSLSAELAKSQGTAASQAQQLSSVQTSIMGLQTQLSVLLSDLNSNNTSNLAFQAMAETELRQFNSSLAALSLQLDSIVPSVPLSTLVIVTDTYDASSATFNFTVKNNLDVVVYAQISAVVYGTALYPCDGSAGVYLSQVFQFPADSTISTSMSLSQVNYTGCGASPITSILVEFQASQSVQVSQAYTFGVVPPYNFK